MRNLLRMPDLNALAEGFLHILYPRLCIACGEDLPAGKSCFCFSCRLKLDPADMHLQGNNEFTDRLWGQIRIESGAAFYYFTRKSPIQHALHQLKYHDKPDVGIKLGREFGYLLKQSPLFSPIDLIVPVPLHPRKEQLRGYNQSAMFAEGIAEAMDRPCLGRALARKVYADSQTKKKRLDRFDNVEASFTVLQPERLKNKHVLLVDDVLTTGATLESCGRIILSITGTKLSMATIAIAVQHSV